MHYRFPRPDTVEVEYMRVRQGHRRRGYARLLYAELLNILRGEHFGVRYANARVTSQRAMRLHNRSFGKPLAIHQGLKRMTMAAASAYLPRCSPERKPGHGVTDLSRDRYVTVRHRLFLGEAPDVRRSPSLAPARAARTRTQ
jgi:hypothetical protein